MEPNLSLKLTRLSTTPKNSRINATHKPNNNIATKPKQKPLPKKSTPKPKPKTGLTHVKSHIITIHTPRLLSPMPWSTCNSPHNDFTIKNNPNSNYYTSKSNNNSRSASKMTSRQIFKQNPHDKFQLSGQILPAQIQSRIQVQAKSFPFRTRTPNNMPSLRQSSPNAFNFYSPPGVRWKQKQGRKQKLNDNVIRCGSFSNIRDKDKKSKESINMLLLKRQMDEMDQENKRKLERSRIEEIMTVFKVREVVSREIEKRKCLGIARTDLEKIHLQMPTTAEILARNVRKVRKDKVNRLMEGIRGKSFEPQVRGLAEEIKGMKKRRWLKECKSDRVVPFGSREGRIEAGNFGGNDEKLRKYIDKAQSDRENEEIIFMQDAFLDDSIESESESPFLARPIYENFDMVIHENRDIDKRIDNEKNRNRGRTKIKRKGE